MRTVALLVLALVRITGSVRAQEAVPAPPADTIAVDWSTNVSAMEKEWERIDRADEPYPQWLDTFLNACFWDEVCHFVAVCPPNGPAGGPLWGTDTYTNDSSICLAAVHAGALTRDEGGTVVVQLGPGLAQYAGTYRNGLTSQPWGAWHASIRFPTARRRGP